MVFFYVDDGLNGNSKARAAGPGPMGLWVMAGSYSGQQLTEGLVPDWWIKTFPGGMKLAARLVEVGLWHAPGGARCKSKSCPARKVLPAGHFAFHDWAVINTQTKASVEKRRAAQTERTRRFREREALLQQSGNALQTPHQSSPVQTRDGDLKGRPPSAGSGSTDDSYPQGESAGEYPAMIAATAVRLSTLAGEPITLAQAGVVVDTILGRAKNVRRPKAYVLGTLTRHGAEWLQFVLTGKEPE